ncbi:helix-turn-helix domain-containing protein [Candidatus Woesearchaeota archaeon]|nr:helix-turn-helix domain-containing protein [Candidatus Woesearchaeota archaeon]
MFVEALNESEFLGELFDKKVVSILSQFLGNPDHEFYLRELSRASKVSPATTHRILFRLEKLDLVESVSVAKFKIYLLKKNKHSEFLSRVIKTEINPLQIFIDKISEIREISSVILHGKKTKTQANVILLGSYFDQQILRQIIDDLKTKYKFDISYLTLSEDQFEKMTQMGLYHENRTVLFER